MARQKNTQNVVARGHVTAVCISHKKGERKTPIDTAQCRANYGIEGDAHAGAGMRQVSFLAQNDIDTMKEHGIKPSPGDFAENVIVSGDAIDNIEQGDYLVIESGPVFRVTMIGKECHDSACPIRQQTGTCIMPSKGVFTEVTRAGKIKTGDSIERYIAEEYQCDETT